MAFARRTISGLVLIVLALRAHAKSKQYEALLPEDYKLAVSGARGGIIIAFLDQTSPDHDDLVAQDAAIDGAASSFGCLVGGGARVMSAEDEKTGQILKELQRQANKVSAETDDDGHAEKIVPPVAFVLANEEVISWTSASHAFVPQHGRQNNWTSAALTEWAYATFGIQVVRDADDLDAFYQSTSLSRIAVGFVDRLCEERARAYVSALSLYSQGHAGTRVPAAISTSMKLAREACGFDAVAPRAPGGVCAYGGSARQSARMPRKKKSEGSIAKWLGSLSSHASSPSTDTSKVEL